MKKLRFRFYDNKQNEMIYQNPVESKDIVFSQWEELAKVSPFMQYIGLEDKLENNIFEEDILSLNASEIDKKSGFWNSNIGKFIKEYEIKEMFIYMKTSNFLQVNYVCFFKKEEGFLTKNQYYQDDSREKDGVYTLEESDLRFLRYLTSKKFIEIVGNSYSHPSLVEIDRLLGRTSEMSI